MPKNAYNRRGAPPPDNGFGGRRADNNDAPQRRGGPARIAALAEKAKRRQSPAFAGADGHRRGSRPSNTTETLTQTLKKGANDFVEVSKTAGKGLARWFGVVDEAQMQHMRKKYVNRKQSLAFEAPALGLRPTGGFPYGDKTNADAIRHALQQAVESDSDDSDEGLTIDVNPEQFTRDLKQGLSHYRMLRRNERKRATKPGWFGGEINRNRRSLKGYRSVRKKAPKKHANIRDDTMVQLQLHNMATFYPWFIYSLTSLQVFITIAMCVHAYTTESFADIGLSSVVVACDLNAPANSELECPKNFAETKTTVVNRTEEYNWSFGPKFQYLMNYGSKFAPCMREDTGIILTASRTRSEECVWQASITASVGYQCDESLYNLTGTNGFACCYLQIDAGTARAGMTSYEQCQAWHDEASKTMLPSSWTEGEICDSSTDFVTLHPCCSGIDETCELTTEEQCTFKQGTYNQDKLLCSDTMCLESSCTFFDDFDTVEADTTLRNIPANPNQWYRFVLPLFIHGGAVHIVLVATVQFYAGKAVEIQAGFLRTFIIYFVSGIGGNIISGIFSPKTVSMGADPAVYGLLGVMIVELFQAWQIIPRPLLQLTKLTIIIAVSLLIGTLPYVDNWSHVGGFFFGIVAGIVFLPYITFGQWDARRKRILILICMPLLLVMCLMATLTFYIIQNDEFCTWCKYLNCVPYTNDIDCSAYF